MERFFLELLNRAICAGWLVPVVWLLRVLLKKMPKWICCLLWGMVAVRLLIPIQIESTVSLIPSVQTFTPDVMYTEKPEIHTGIGILNETVNPVISDHFAPKPGDSVNPMQVLTTVASWVWLAGAAFLLLYAAASYLRLRIHVRTAVPVRQEAGYRSIPVLESERVDSPFVLGLVRPRVYLPMKVEEVDRNYIISHELAHIRRKDHWIKPFGYFLLAVYWFHPLLWAAYIMLCRDIEYACDERVVKRYDVEERKAYSTALLTCSVRRFRIAACPVAFGEVGVRQRVKGVLHYKKPAFWVLLAAALSLVIVAVCFLTNPKTDGDAQPGDGSAEETTDAGDGSGA
ncbi:MAG: M56 family metallopeptidase [Lachnospiraceae bacterium]|nr:M56 family metallopeptidase [Lachnospiraceae bacterium]